MDFNIFKLVCFVADDRINIRKCLKYHSGLIAEVLAINLTCVSSFQL